MSDRNSDIIFCEGCGARLNASDRTCPKCGRPAPGILSTQSAASDLAAGKTASFPRLTADLLAEGKAAPSAPQILADSLDPAATNVLDADRLRAAEDASRRSSRKAEKAAKAALAFAERAAADDYRRPRRGRWIALACAVALVAGGAWFVAKDPLGVMPGVYASIDRSAAEMFPSRQVSEQAAGENGASDNGQDSANADGDKNEPSISDTTLSEDEAYQRLSSIYGRILGFQDEIGPVVDDYNGWFKASDLDTRKNAAASAYALRKSVQATLDELDGLKLADGSAYTEDVDHLRQLATWMYNRVDVLCRSWDISLSYTGDDLPYQHEDEILQPLREIEMRDGKAVDVIEFENNVYAWQPQKK